MGGDQALRQRRPAITVALWLFPLVVTSGWLLAAFTAPSDGTVTAQRADGWSHQMITIDDVLAAGSPLRPGDRLVAVDGVPVERLARHPGTLRLHDGQVLRYTVLRPAPQVRNGSPDDPARGPWQQIELPVRLGGFPLADGLDHHLPVILLALTMYLIATFVVVHRPREPAARALYLIATTIPVTVSAYPFSPQAIDVVSGRLWPFVVADLGNCVIWGALLHFAVVFPQPLKPVARRPWLVSVAYLLPLAYQGVRLAVILPSVNDPLARLQLLAVPSQWAAHVQPFLVAAAVVFGYRSAPDALVRRRMRWSVTAIGVAAAFYLALGQIPARLIGHPLAPWDWLVLLFLPFPVGIGLTVLRYRLFDIQIMVRRSLVLGAVTAGLGTLYLGMVAAASRYTQLPAAVAPFAASLVVAVIFGPLRTYARRMVSRSLFGDRDDPYEVMDRLSQRLAATGSADSVLVTVVETLAETLRLSYAAIRLDGAADRPIAYGVRAGPSIQVPITHAGERVGELEIDPGPHREPFGLADQKLLDGLARQVGMISQNLLLEIRLRHSLERLITTREEERRRLRRDLHDGLGPALATTAMQVELAASLIDRDPMRAKEILTGLGAAQREAVAGLRRLVDGLRPPVLDRLGLVGALRDTAEMFSEGPDALAVDVQAEAELEPLPAAIEMAAYRLTQEALTNVVKHARAGHCEVRLWRDADALLIQVTDDGLGLPSGYRAGVGINAIRERATEIGGSASVTPGPEKGTVVFARLPLRSAQPPTPASS